MRNFSINSQIVKSEVQHLLFAEHGFVPNNLPTVSELQPSHNLSGIFDECHNYIYANEGFLKDKIFNEMVKLLAMKLHDEQTASDGYLKFGITSNEYRSILANAPSTFQDRMNELLRAVSDKYRNLFPDTVLKLQPLTLAYVVARLQYTSLTNTPGDIKGEAFQSFVCRHQRGDRGEFFTPYPIVRLAVEMIDPKPGEKVIDPACGSGGFLIQTISYIERNNRNFSKSAYIQQCIRGIEFNPDVALSATIRLAFEGGTGTQITCANALAENDHLNNLFDIVLTNPPFGSKGKIQDQRILKSYVLARKWNKVLEDDWQPTKAVLHGQSPEILFIEKCLTLLKPAGRMAIVLPDGLLHNITNSHIRFWMRSQAKVLGVVSIPQEAFVPYGTGIKTSLLLLQRLPAARRTTCFIARMQKIGYDVKGQPLFISDEYGRQARTDSGMRVIDDDVDEIASAYRRLCHEDLEIQTEKIYTVPDQLLNSRLDAEHYQPADQELIHHLKATRAKPLGEIADILKKSDNFRVAAHSEIRYISISDVDSRTMQVVSQQAIKAREAPSRATYRVRDGDIITAISGASTGTQRQASALITKDEDGAICSNGFAVLRNIHGVQPLFLLAYMRTEYYLRQVRRLMTGHAIPSISIEDLSRILVPIPAIHKQRKIAQAFASIQAMRKEALRLGEAVVRETETLLSQLRRAH